MISPLHRSDRTAVRASTPSRTRADSLPATAANFLRTAAGLALGSAFLRPRARMASAHRPSKKRKVVVITFGGGARDQETFAPEGQENIPHLMRELIPQSTFFTQVVNRGILGHYVATASLATGVYETINNFAALPPAISDGVRVFPQRLEASRLGCLGGRSQQRFQPHRREQPSFLRCRARARA